MPRHALAATTAKKPEEIAASSPAPPAAESGKGAKKAEKKPKEAAKEPEAESSEMKPEKDTAAPAPAAPPPLTPPQARPTVAIGGFTFVPVGPLATDQPPYGGDPFIADFAHGSDGLGNLFLSAPTTKKVEETAAEFMVNMVSQFPGEVSVLALGPLTNVALAIKRDPSFANKVKKIVVLGVLSL
ncbi:hypothetical protein GUJ93_ZPchr0004g39925 [Zizania palustris]|uniref:Inosine/uridine-preferring nucleoside hydrolase domain-containing protein n=1 Tax=Zizania palustris TaxID=103762 RepID=A0A8J5SIX1_ZIZPA|nr:hypothetical protein GUJ93_ZPchr0004g39925 [Zizania palustris]